MRSSITWLSSVCPHCVPSIASDTSVATCGTCYSFAHAHPRPLCTTLLWQASFSHTSAARYHVLFVAPRPLCAAHHLSLLCCLFWQDATDLVARLRAFHHASQSQPDKKGLSQCGLDLVQGKVRGGGRKIKAVSARTGSCFQISCNSIAHGLVNRVYWEGYVEREHVCRSASGIAGQGRATVQRSRMSPALGYQRLVVVLTYAAWLIRP